MSGDGAQKERVAADQATGIADDGDVKLDPDFATAPALSRGERRFFQRMSNVLRFTDFMIAMMVMATFLSAYATWRTAQVTNLLFTVAERPYMGVEEVTVDSVDKEFARVVIDCRNFGQVQATNGVGRIAVTVDGKALPNENASADTDNFGIVSPTVPHRIFRFVPKSLYEQVREGRSRMIVHIEFDYRGPDQRQFCYEKLFSYDRRSADFIPNGGNDRCDGEIYLRYRCTRAIVLAVSIPVGEKMRCPICKKTVDGTAANRFRPFCSERCRMVDLGTWAGEDYRVPGAAVEDREHPDDLKEKKKILH